MDPDAAAREREDAHRTRHRVEARREQSGNASFAIREASVSVLLSVEAAINELAVRLRNAGAEGTLDSLRAVAALDRLLNRDPLERLAPLPPEPAAEDGYPEPPDGHGYPDPPDGHGYPEPPDSRDYPEPLDSRGYPKPPDSHDYPEPNGCGTPADRADDGTRHRSADGGDTGAAAEDEGGSRSASGTGTPVGRQVRFPALVNLIVPAATLLGWGTAPGQADAWGLLDPQETRAIVQAASRDPRTRWCFTVVDGQGAAVAHACAPGRHPWNPESPPPRKHLGDPPAHSQELSATQRSARMQEFPVHPQSVGVQELLADLGFTPGAVEPIAHGACNHRHAEPGYAPSLKLRHLVRARSQSCTAPGCGGQSVHADHDHVVPFPEGPTDECNLHTPCRAHHRAKQSPGWDVEQPEPGILRWTLPSGRVRITRPTSYDC